MRGFIRLDECLACGAGDLVLYLDLGEQPLANTYRERGDGPLKTFPLGLQRCVRCWHSQNLVSVDPDLMFRDYPYVSGTSASLRHYFTDFVFRVEEGFPPNKPFRVLEIASNDGTLLRSFAARGHKVQGVDPAQNLAIGLKVSGDVPTICDYWHRGVVELLADEEPYDVVVAMNVLGHVANPLNFLQLCKQVLAPGGRIYIQTSQARMIERGEFDTCYHEHLSFFTVSSWVALARRAGLFIDKISHVDVHGTSYLVELINRPGAAEIQVAEDYELGHAEKGRGYYQVDIYDSLQTRAQQSADWVRTTLVKLESEGWDAAGYGAAAKGMTFLNFAGVELGVIFDDNPLKQGKIAPCGAEIVAPGHLDQMGKIAFLIPAWNMEAEIVDKIKALRPNSDDRFLTYFPTPNLHA